MENETDLLFVYGTLLSNAHCELGRAPRERLKGESTIVGAGRMRGGVLYDLGDYPGLVATEAGNDWVTGEILQLKEPSHTFQWLDAYEDAATDGDIPAMYTRAVRDVLLRGIEPVQVQVYLYLPSVEGVQPVVGGDWLGWTNQRRLSI